MGQGGLLSRLLYRPPSNTTGESIQEPIEDTRPLWKKLAEALLINVSTGMLGIGTDEALDKPLSQRTVGDWASGTGAMAGVFPPALIGARKAWALKRIPEIAQKFDYPVEVEKVLKKVATKYPRVFSRIGGIHPDKFGQFHPPIGEPSLKEITKWNKQNATTPEGLTPVGHITLQDNLIGQGLESQLKHELAHSVTYRRSSDYAKYAEKNLYKLHPDEINARVIQSRKSRSFLQDYLDEANNSFKHALPAEISEFESSNALQAIRRKFRDVLKDEKRQIFMIRRSPNNVPELKVISLKNDTINKVYPARSFRDK